MAKKRKSKPASKPAATATEATLTLPAPEPTTPATPAVSKMSMVREALTKLGNNTPPWDIGQFVQEKYGVELTTTMISSYKSNITRGDTGGRSTSGRGRANGATFGLDTVGEVKELIDKLGAKQLSELVEVLA